MMEEHIRQKHTDFPCNFCNKLFKKHLLKGHMETCDHRLRQCPYCELEVEDCEMGSHLKQCGSKTEVCFICNKIFLVREMTGHIKLCENNILNQNQPVLNNENDFKQTSSISEESSNKLERLDSVTEALIKFAQMEEDMKLASEL